MKKEGANASPSVAVCPNFGFYPKDGVSLFVFCVSVILGTAVGAAGCTAFMAKTKTSKLKIIPLGGVDGIGKNMTVFEYEDDMFAIDCGVSFPEGDMLGVDLVIPDFSYIEANSDKFRGLVLTHGHEDHIGAVPYFLKAVNAPVYGTRLTLGILENKLLEHGLVRSSELYEVSAGQSFKLGCFTVEFIRVNHSIPDAVAVAVHTPRGIVVHTGDFKVDYTPISGEPIDLLRFAELGKKGVKLLLCESTNVERSGYTPSERVVGASFDRIFFNLDKRVVIATFSSNVHRIQQIIDASVKYGRKVAVTGRSMINVISAAERLGYMKIPEGTLIELSDLNRYNPSQITLITTGSQGEPMSALYRMALGEHSSVSLGSNDLVILSSSPIPGNEKLIAKVTNELLKRGVELINDILADVHVSGHACEEELKLMHALTKPDFFMPIHGEYKHLKRHADLAKYLGMDEKRISVPENGKVYELDNKKLCVSGTVPADPVFVDGYGVGEIGSVVLKERKHLSEDGMLMVVAALDMEIGTLLSKIEVISRGFVYMKDSESLIEEVRTLAARTVDECFEKGVMDLNTVRSKVKEAVSSKLYSRTKKRPMVMPILLDIGL